jgi:putative chitinase
MPATPQERLELFLEPLLAAMEEFDINTPQRQAAFLAQIAHESGGLKYVRELASGDAYEGRKDLGNTHPGDGPKFRGHGLIQITGRANHQECGDALGLDLIEHPELLEEPTNACRSAAWFWKKKGLNELADADNFRVITIRINGGVNGMADRLKYWARAQEVLA